MLMECDLPAYHTQPKALYIADIVNLIQGWEFNGLLMLSFFKMKRFSPN